MRYRVIEPDTPAELAPEFLQVYESEIPLEVGMAWEMEDGVTWQVVSVADDPDPSYAGRVVLTQR